MAPINTGLCLESRANLRRKGELDALGNWTQPGAKMLETKVGGAEQPCLSCAQGGTDTQPAAWQPVGASLIKKVAQNRKNGNK